MFAFRPRLYWFYEGKLYSWLQAFIGYAGYTAGYDGWFSNSLRIFFTSTNKSGFQSFFPFF